MTVTTETTRNGVTPPPPHLGTRGRWLWRQVADDGPALRPAELVILEEACRLADRLDRLDAQLRGDEDSWLRLRVGESGTSVVIVDKALSEARQQQVALKQLLAELRTSRADSPGKPRRGQGGQARTSGTGAHVSKGGGGGVLVDLAARIADRAG